MKALCTCVLPVDDLAAAALWYAALFEVEPYFEQPFYVGFDVNGYELGLVPASDAARPSTHGADALWGCEDIHAAHARALERGATELVAPWNTGDGIRVSSLADPFGNRLSFIENPHFRVPRRDAVVVVARQTQLAAGGVRSFSCTQAYAASPARVFAAWTREEEVATWFGAAARVELRIGGPFEVYFLDASAPARGSEGCVVLSWLPDRMLSFTWNAPPHLPYVRERRTWVVVDIAATPGGSVVTLTHTGWPEDGFAGAVAHPEWAATWSYFQAAWPRVLANLRRHVEETAPAA